MSSYGPAHAKIRTILEADGSWTSILYVSGAWHGRLTGFASAQEARKAIRRKYL